MLVGEFAARTGELYRLFEITLASVGFAVTPCRWHPRHSERRPKLNVLLRQIIGGPITPCGP
jgi:hypothetical protein